METFVDARWEVRQAATVTWLLPAGLAPGKPAVAVEEHIRASYTPFIAAAQAGKPLTLA